MNKIIQLIQKYNSVAKFLIVGVSASVVHAAISWVFYYHIWVGATTLSTLIGYSGGWVLSYIGNRLWSFRWQAQRTSVVSSSAKFLVKKSKFKNSISSFGVALIET